VGPRTSLDDVEKKKILGGKKCLHLIANPEGKKPHVICQSEVIDDPYKIYNFSQC
jgi:hypothetical protein